MAEVNRLKIVHGCFVAGNGCAEGDIIEVDDETAFDLLNLSYALPADETTGRRFKTAPRSFWREEETEPLRRFVKVTP